MLFSTHHSSYLLDACTSMQIRFERAGLPNISSRSLVLKACCLASYSLQHVRVRLLFIRSCCPLICSRPSSHSSRQIRMLVVMFVPGQELTIIEANFARQILEGIVGSKLMSSGLQVEAEHPLNYVSLATQTEGYLATDLHDLVSRAVHQATIRAAKEQSEVRARSYLGTLNQTLLDFTSAQRF
jgi:hypothetical protein